MNPVYYYIPPPLPASSKGADEQLPIVGVWRRRGLSSRSHPTIATFSKIFLYLAYISESSSGNETRAPPTKQSEPTP